MNRQENRSSHRPQESHQFDASRRYNWWNRVSRSSCSTYLTREAMKDLPKNLWLKWLKKLLKNWSSEQKPLMVALIPWKAQQSNIENEEENRGSLEKRNDSKGNEKLCYCFNWSNTIPKYICPNCIRIMWNGITNPNQPILDHWHVYNLLPFLS